MGLWSNALFEKPIMYFVGTWKFMNRIQWWSVLNPKEISEKICPKYKAFFWATGFDQLSNHLNK